MSFYSTQCLMLLNDSYSLDWWWASSSAIVVLSSWSLFTQRTNKQTNTVYKCNTHRCERLHSYYYMYLYSNNGEWRNEGNCYNGYIDTALTIYSSGERYSLNSLTLRCVHGLNYWSHRIDERAELIKRKQIIIIIICFRFFHTSILMPWVKLCRR